MFMNKGLALAESLKLLGISPDDVVVAGDETTDIAMMRPELARFAVCPENSAEAVKRHVLSMGGTVGVGHSSKGVMDAFAKLAESFGFQQTQGK
jgi:hydroxymethylpyrimidine pyrophosphatase-like HAD family hydrolase